MEGINSNTANGIKARFADRHPPKILRHGRMTALAYRIAAF